MQAQDAGCRVSKCEVQNAAEPGTCSVTFLTHQELRSGEVAELPLAEVAVVRPATPPAALPALHPPSQVPHHAVFLKGLSFLVFFFCFFLAFFPSFFSRQERIQEQINVYVRLLCIAHLQS